MKTVVFLGPTLCVEEAKIILPHAIYLPPVSSGDIFHVTRLKPDIIAIIDGYFEKKASVHHKEILFALESGIAVFGASSMGALRARECSAYGMIGVGKIYEKYVVDCNEDDSVAMLHGSSFDNYSPKTIPLVDVMATLEKAFSENIITTEIADCVEKYSRELFYIHRTEENILKGIVSLALKKWIRRHGWVNQKKEDAILLLQHLSSHVSSLRACAADVAIQNSAWIATSAAQARNDVFFPRSLFFRAHYKKAMCQPFPYDHDALPSDEKIALKIKNNDIIYRQLQRIAYLLSISFALAKKYVRNVDWEKLDSAKKRFEVIEKLIENHRLTSVGFRLDPEIQGGKIGLSGSRRSCAGRQMIRSSTEHLFHLHHLMRLSSENEYHLYRSQVSSRDEIANKFLEDSPIKYRVFELYAKLWEIVEYYISDFIPNPRFIQIYSDKFRLKQKLLTPEKMTKWLQRNNLNIKEYQELMTLGARLNYIVMQNNHEVLGLIDDTENIWWFLDAMQLSGVYGSLTQC